MSNQGDRVGAILDTQDNAVNFLGYGVYEGNFVPTEAAGFMAEALCEANITNPRIKLDKGGVVYGCECWWGAEGTVKKQIDSFEVVNHIKIDDVRKELEAPNDK